MAKKMTSEAKYDTPHFNVKIGTLDKANPDEIYIECGTFISPTEQLDTYDDVIMGLEKRLKQILRTFINSTTYFKPNHIAIFEVSTARIKKGKKSYLSIQIHFSPDKIGKFSGMEQDIRDMLYSLLNNFAIEINQAGFYISRSKKDPNDYLL